MVSYQTAWLKANHPVEFMAAVMNCDIHLTDKLGAYKQEVRPARDRGGAALRQPLRGDLRASRTGAIVYALGALKNVGVEAMRLITDARAAGGPLHRALRLRRRGSTCAGSASGRSRCWRGPARSTRSTRTGARCFESLEALIAYSAAAHDERASAQVSLFGEAADALPAPRLPQPEDWSPMERLAQEQPAIGFYLSGHPLDDYARARCAASGC